MEHFFNSLIQKIFFFGVFLGKEPLS
jgi:hypothetical protein